MKNIDELEKNLLEALNNENFNLSFELYCKLSDLFRNMSDENISLKQKQWIRFLLKIMSKSRVNCDDTIYTELKATIAEDDVKTQNILLNEYEIYKKQIELKSKPQSLQITLTTKCNARCKMCGNITKPIWEVSEYGIKSIIQILPYIQDVTWMGGEVFLHNKFKYLVEQSSLCETEQNIITNGIISDMDIVELLVMNNVRTSVSIHSFNRDIYKYITGKDCLDNIYKFLENINKLRKKYFCLSLNMVVMKSNYKEINNLFDLALKYNINEIILLPLHCEVQVFYDNENIFFGDNINFDIIKYVREETQELESKLKTIGVKFINQLPVFEYLNKINNNGNIKKDLIPIATLKCNEISPKQKYKICHYPWTKLFVENDGEILISSSCRNMISYPMGHIDKDSLLDVWNNDKIKKIRSKIIKDHCSEYCQKILD